jgi:phenylacetate-CoA ligase
MSTYGTVFRRVVYPYWETTLRQRPTLGHRQWLERTQWASHDELCAIQAGELRRLLQNAFDNVPHYRQILEQRGLRPEDFRSVEDLARLPVLDRAAARAAGDSRKATRAPLCDLTKATGGSTGEPLRFGYDLGSEYWRQAVKLRGWGWTGYRVGDPTLFMWGPPTNGPFGWTRRAKIAGDRLLRRETYVDCTNRGEAELRTTVDRILRRRPENLIFFTNAGVDLARHIVDRGLQVPRMNVLCCGEALEPRSRALLTAAFGERVFETYGCREVMLIGSECEEHDGLHVSMENLIVEVVVREGGRVRAAAPGERGEVAITDLHNYGMPFIRYLNGDLAVAARTDRCRCGRGLARLAAIDGRVADTLRDGHGAPVCGILVSRIFSCSDALSRAVLRWQCVQHTDGSVTMRLQTRQPLTDEAQADIRRNFARYMKGVPLRTEVVADIPLGDNGKARPIVIETGGATVTGRRLAS